MTTPILNFFKRPPRRAGGKDHPMTPGTHPSGPPVAPAPAAPPDPTAALTDAVRQLAQSQKALLDALRPAAAAGQPAPSGGTSLGAPHAGEDIRRIVSDLLRERESSTQRTAARDRYVRERMADLPDAYRRLMPEADDAADLAAAEADVRRRFRDDFRAAASATGSPAAADVSGDAPGGRRPAAAVDYSRLSPLQQITVGLRDARAPQDGPRAGAAPPPRRASEGLEDGEDAGAVSGATAEEFFGAD